MFALLKSVGRHFAIYGLGNFVNYLVGFFLLPLYTHYLTPSDYGTLELIELTVYIAGMFMGAGILNAVLRFYYDTDDPLARNTVISTAILSTVIAAILVGSLLLGLAPKLAELIFGSQELAPLLQLAVVSLALSVVSQVPLVVIRAREQSILYVSFSLVQLLLNVACNVWFIVYLHWGIRGILWGGIITKLLATAFLLSYTLPHTGFRLSLKTARSMFSYGFPLVFGSLSIFVLNFSDRFFLKRMRSLSEVGLYALGYKFGMLINPMVTDPFLAIWKPKMFEIAARADAGEVYAKMLTYFLFLEMFVVVSVSVLIKDVIALFTDAAYHDAHQIVPVILLAYVLWGACSHIQIGILLAKRTKYIAYLTAVAAASNVAGNVLLIPRLGMWGAALTTFGSYALLLGSTVYYSRRFLMIPYEVGRIGKILLASALVYSAAMWADSLPWQLVTIPLKLGLALTFPLVLLPLRFYGPAEIEKIKEFRGIARDWLHQRWTGQ